MSGTLGAPWTTATRVNPLPRSSMTAIEWVTAVRERRVPVGSPDGAIALAVIDLLRFYLKDELRGPWDDRQDGRRAAIEILSGLRYPKAAEAASLMSCSDTAVSLGFLIAGRLKWLGGLTVYERPPRGLTRLDLEAVGMTEIARTYGVPLPPSGDRALGRDETGPATTGQRSSVTFHHENEIKGREDHPSSEPPKPHRGAPVLLTLVHRVGSSDGAYETRPEVAAPMTIREMVRQVMPRDRGRVLSNAQIREQVQSSFEAGVSDRQIDQAIVGLRRDGELRRVGRAQHVATKHLGHDPIPTDPTRRRARP